MKRESRRRGAVKAAASKQAPGCHQAARKILTKKKPTRLSKAKVQHIKARRIGAEAALEALMSEELCRDLAVTFARKSSTRTGEKIRSVRDCYEAIALEFRRLDATQANGERQSLSSALLGKYETLDALNECLPKLGKWIREYAFACIRGEQRKCTWSLSSHRVRDELLIALAEEYVRDREGLMRFLSACFKRWRKIDAPSSLHRFRVVIQQLAARFGHGRKRLLDESQKRGVIPGDKALKAGESSKLRYNIGQILRRDQRTAVKKGFGSSDRQKPASFRLHRPSEFAVRRNVERR
jgi:hypothetical protein